MVCPHNTLNTGPHTTEGIQEVERSKMPEPRKPEPRVFPKDVKAS